MKPIPGIIRTHEGSTLLERVAAGQCSAQDLEIARQQEAQHQEWLKSPSGRRFLRRQRAQMRGRK